MRRGPYTQKDSGVDGYDLQNIRIILGPQCKAMQIEARTVETTKRLL